MTLFSLSSRRHSDKSMGVQIGTQRNAEKSLSGCMQGTRSGSLMEILATKHLVGVSHEIHQRGASRTRTMRMTSCHQRRRARVVHRRKGRVLNRRRARVLHRRTLEDASTVDDFVEKCKCILISTHNICRVKYFSCIIKKKNSLLCIRCIS